MVDQVVRKPKRDTMLTDETYAGYAGHPGAFEGLNAAPTGTLNNRSSLVMGENAGTTRGDIYVTPGAGGVTPRSSTGKQTTTTTYAGKAPEKAPVFELPEEWTPGRRAGEIQSQAALGLKQNRQALREAISSLGQDPASRLALRDALTAHGINVERTLLGAKTAAQQEESRVMNRQFQEAQAAFASQQAAFENEWRKYLSTAQTTTTTESSSGPGMGGGEDSSVSTDPYAGNVVRHTTWNFN